MENNGVITVQSNHSFQQTAEKLEGLIQDKGMMLIARVNHSAGAEKIGQTLNPTELFLFGNPQGGTPLMQNQQTVGMDLPQKMLIWQDDQQQVWLSYNSPDYLGERHSITGCDALIEKIGNVLNDMANQATN